MIIFQAQASHSSGDKVLMGGGEASASPGWALSSSERVNSGEMNERFSASSSVVLVWYKELQLRQQWQGCRAHYFLLLLLLLQLFLTTVM